MGNTDRLFSDFCQALNGELAAMGCGLTVSAEDPGDLNRVLLVDIDGSRLGWIPDHVDAEIIAAFGAILSERETALSM